MTLIENLIRINQTLILFFIQTLIEIFQADLERKKIPAIHIPS
jgi:hypothetical protein